MSRSLIAAFLPVFLITCFTAVYGQKERAPADARIQLKVNTDEAEAVLVILDKRAAGTAVGVTDWQRLFASEPYIRLQKREAAMHRAFTDDDFKKFVLSPDLVAKATALRKTLNAWEHADLTASAHRALAYLPDEAIIKAKVFPEIKPIANSFVFDTDTDPTIFLYLDPEESAAKFENTVAHELHHIGFSSISSLTAEKQKNLPPNVQPAVEWMGAFGEGFAMLAAAGGPDVDPHTASCPAEHARWNHDLANFNPDPVALAVFSRHRQRHVVCKRADQRNGVHVFRRRSGPVVHRRLQNGRRGGEALRAQGSDRVHARSARATVPL